VTKGCCPHTVFSLEHLYGLNDHTFIIVSLLTDSILLYSHPVCMRGKLFSRGFQSMCPYNDPKPPKNNMMGHFSRVLPSSFFIQWLYNFLPVTALIHGCDCWLKSVSPQQPCSRCTVVSVWLNPRSTKPPLKMSVSSSGLISIRRLVKYLISAVFVCDFFSF